MIRNNLQSSANNNSNPGKNQQFQSLNLEQLDAVSGGGGGTLIPVKVKHNV